MGRFKSLDKFINFKNLSRVKTLAGLLGPKCMLTTAMLLQPRIGRTFPSPNQLNPLEQIKGFEPWTLRLNHPGRKIPLTQLQQDCILTTVAPVAQVDRATDS